MRPAQIPASGRRSHRAPFLLLVAVGLSTLVLSMLPLPSASAVQTGVLKPDSTGGSSPAIGTLATEWQAQQLNGGVCSAVWDCLDEGTATPDDDDTHVRGPNKIDGYVDLNIPAMPADFAKAQTATITARYEGGIFSAHPIAIQFEIVSAADVSLTDRTTAVDVNGLAWTTGSWTVNVTGSTDKATWDGAQIRVHHDYQGDGSGITPRRARFSAVDATVTYDRAPNAPATLVQRKINDTVIAAGTSTDESSVELVANISDPDNPDSLQLCVEVKTTGTAMNGTTNVTCSGLAAYSGTVLTHVVTVTGLADNTNYHWRAQARDTAGVPSTGWVSYGGSDGTTDFRVSVPDPPNAPAILVQRKINDTVIAAGTSTDENSVELVANISDPDNPDSLQLCVEVKTSGTAMNGTTNVTCSTLAAYSGTALTHVVTVTGMVDNTNYHWRAQARDSGGRTSTGWVSYGGSDGTTDFRVSVPDPPNAPATLVQRKINDTVIAAGASTDENSVELAANISDPDNPDSLQLCVEVKTSATAMNGTTNVTCSTLAAYSGTALTHVVTVTGLVDNTNYHWRAQARDSGGRTSTGWVSYGGSDGTTDFSVSIPNAPNAPSVTVYRSNGTTVIANGGTTTENQAIFKAAISDPDNSGQLRLCVQYQTVGGSWTGPELCSALAAYTGTPLNHQVNPTGLADGGYEWRAQVRDNSGLNSTWTSGGPDDTATDFTVATNVAPGTPTALAQLKTDDSTIAASGWTNQTTVRFSASILDTSPTDTLSLCVELKALNSAFTGTTGITCTTPGVASTGVTRTVTVDVTGLTPGTQYHWQAHARDAAAATSAWASFGTADMTARDFGVDTAAPTTSAVRDGTTGTDASFNDGSLTSLSANWNAFTDTASGMLRYWVSVGTTSGGADKYAETSQGNVTTVNLTVFIRTGELYYVTVRGEDSAGNFTAPVTSNGQMVAPVLNFTLSTTTLDLGNIGAGNQYTRTAFVDMTTTTNARNGYLVSTSMPTMPTQTSTAFQLGGFTGGTAADPDAWLAGEQGVGFTSTDPLVEGVNRFQPATCRGGNTLVTPGCYAPFSAATVPVADESGPVTSSTFRLHVRTTANATTQAGRYQGRIVFHVSARF